MPVEVHSSYLPLLGSLFTEDKGLKILLSLKEAKIVAVKNPTPGLWKITTSSSGSHTLRITGLSSMYMTTGFGLKPVNRQEDAQAQPHAGNVLEDVYCRINKILQVIELRHQVLISSWDVSESFHPQISALERVHFSCLEFSHTNRFILGNIEI